MPVVIAKPKEPRVEEVDWARLIPGEASTIRAGSKKRPQSVREASAVMPQPSVKRSGNAFALWTPKPFGNRTGWKWLQSVVTDWALVAVNWLFVGALLVPLREFFPYVRSFRFEAGTPMPLIGIAVLHAALITLVGYSEGLNSPGTEPHEQARILAKSVSAATSVLCVAYFLQGASWVIGGLFCLAGALHFGALLGWRWRLGEHQRIGTRTDARNVLVVGANRVGRRIAAHIQANPGGRRFCGIIDDERPLSADVVGHIPDLARLARQHFVDEIILAAPRNSDMTRQVLSEARRLRLDVEIVPELFGFDPAESEIEQVGGMPVICMHTEKLPALGLFVKRTVDVLVAAAALSLCAPLFVVIAVLIKLDSPGPVFYRAQRAGKKGRLFFCCKFRTMVCNADQLRPFLRQHNERNGPTFKISADPRITRPGSYLRRYSLDELPQFWNVLKGEMSLVGPRPHPADEVAEYETGHLGRLDITPGITGLWQVTARRDPSFQRAMELDRQYIRNWNLGMDFRILLKTIGAVVQGSGQ